MKTQDFVIGAALAGVVWYLLRNTGDTLEENVVYVSGQNLMARGAVTAALSARGVAWANIAPMRLARIVDDPELEGIDLVFAVRRLATVKTWRSDMIPLETLGTQGLDAAVAFAQGDG